MKILLFFSTCTNASFVCVEKQTCTNLDMDCPGNLVYFSEPFCRYTCDFYDENKEICNERKLKRGCGCTDGVIYEGVSKVLHRQRG